MAAQIIKDGFIDRFIQIQIENGNIIRPQDIAQIRRIGNITYDNVYRLIGQDPTQDIFNENMMGTAVIKRIIPYRCYFSEAMAARFNRLLQLNDGNCLFHSIAAGLNLTLPPGNRTNNIIVRDQICNFMVANRDIFLHFFTGILDADQMTFDQYVLNMRQANTWGDIPQIFMAMLLYGRTIFIYQMNGELSNIFEDTKQGYIQSEYRNRYQLGGEPINLYWCSIIQHNQEGYHYELLIPRPQAQAQAQAQPQAQPQPQPQAQPQPQPQPQPQAQRLPLPRVQVPSSAASEDVSTKTREEVVKKESSEKNAKQAKGDADMTQGKTKRQKIEDGSIDKFYMKYMKYKEKYIRLKNSSI